jgi:hypothetical protein
MTLVGPPVDAIDVTFSTWVAYRPVVRVCSTEFPPNTFNPGLSPGRFRPFPPPPATPIATMYGSNSGDGALGETVFHDVPTTGGPWDVPRASLYGQVRTVLIPLRDLSLVDLTNWAHKALGVDGRALVDCEPTEYPITARWGERLHDLPEAPDGIYWRSRQFDSAFVMLLFGDRVGTNELHVVYDETVALWQGEGLRLVLDAAQRANVTIALS